MKKLIFAVSLMVFLVNLGAIVLDDLDSQTRDNVIDCLEGKIELEEGETIPSVEGDEYHISVVTTGYVVVVDKDGNVMYVPKS
jgi:hypothetical protein